MKHDQLILLMNVLGVDYNDEKWSSAMSAE